MPMHLVTSGEDTAVVVDLIYRPANFEGNCDLVTTLAQAGADLNVGAEDRMTALHVSVSQGHFSIAMRLLGLGADPNLTDTNDVLPLQSLLKAHPTTTDPASAGMQQALIDHGVGKPVRPACFPAERCAVDDQQRFLYDSKTVIHQTFRELLKPRAFEGPRATHAFLLSLS